MSIGDRELLDALDDRGIAGLTLAAIAARLGTTEAAVAAQVGGRSDLLDRGLVAASRRLSEAIAAVTEQPGTQEHVLASAAAYIGAARRWPAAFGFVFAPPPPDHAPSPAAVATSQATFDPIARAASAWLRRQYPKGERPRDHQAAAVRLARIMWALVQGQIVLELAGHGSSTETDALVPLGLTSILEGWKVG